MSIRQLQVATDAIQDRLILRVGTSANEEIRIYITRRFLREIWPHLTGMLHGHLAATPGLPGIAAQDAEATCFEQAFVEDNPTYPLGAAPLLASEAAVEATGGGKARLVLREGRERSFNLHLTAELLQALCAMLRAANEQARWDLPLSYDAPLPSGRPVPQALLH